MKKFTALALVVLMLVMSVPFVAFAAPKWTEVKTADDFAKMTDGNYWLTADIDLSKAAWTTIAEFKGTLNGNGHTVTVPKDTTMIDKLSGTVKNLNLVGTMTLDNADTSKFEAKNGNFKGPFVGVLANQAFGATIDNVDTNVNVTFTQDAANAKIVSFGALVGVAMASYDITAENAISITRKTVITNCTTDGTTKFTLGTSGLKGCVGGIVGVSYGNVDVKSCAFYGDITTTNTHGQNGGIVGSAYTDAYMNDDGSKFTNIATDETKNGVLFPVLVENCLDAGKISAPTNSDQSAGLVGYARGLNLRNSISIGEVTIGSGRNVPGIFGYSNITKNDWASVIVEGCAAIGTYKNSAGNFTRVIYGKGTGSFANNNLLVTGQDIFLEGGANMETQAVGNTEVGDKAAVAAAFVRNNPNAFKLNNGVVEIILPAYTAEADPDFSAGNQGGNDNVQTGDMTAVLVVVSVVSLAAVTVIAKKKVTE